MKKRVFLLLALYLLAVSSSASGDGRPFYIYRNDGKLHAFFTSRVDSIVHSRLDTDSVEHEDYVTNEVWTPDSVYRIPLAAIDSIGFVTPATEYQPDAVRLEGELRDYLVACDSLTLTFRADTPGKLLPRPGDKLVTLEMSDMFPSSFAGEVLSVSPKAGGIVVECGGVALHEVFKCYYGVTDSSEEAVGRARVPAGYTIKSGEYKGSVRVSPGTIDFSTVVPPIPTFSQDDYAIKYEDSHTFKVTPSWDVSAFVIVTPFYETYFSFTVIGDYDLELGASTSGKIEWSKDIPHPVEPSLPIPGVSFVKAYLGTGLYLALETEMSAEWSNKRHFRSVFHRDWSTRTGSSLNQESRFWQTSSETSFAGCMKGKLGGGMYVEAGFNIIDRDLCKVCLRAELGWSMSSNALLYADDRGKALTGTEVYKKMQEAGLSVDKEINTSLGFGFVNNVGISWDTPLSWKENIWKADYVPTFSTPIVTQEDKGVLKVETTAKGYVQMNHEVGFALLDKDKEVLKTIYCDKSDSKITGYFTDVVPGREYYVHPIVNTMGVEMLADPGISTTLEASMVTYSASNVSPTSATLNGSTDADITGTDARLGFVYSTSSNPMVGSATFLPVASKGGNYAYALSGLQPETTYYYRACLIMGGETLYGDVVSFTTEEKKDGPTPGTLIDLGLSVKWASCNVGANKPEEYGGYYAWGETNEKTEYDWDTYAYHGTGGYINIGDDISGTGYDVARIRWGGSWRMPTKAECDELVRRCTRTWITYNGVNGLLITGPTGNSIFLPAAGDRFYESLENTGLNASVWSSTAALSSYAYVLSFFSGGSDLHNFHSCFIGHTVRPVSE